MNSRDESQNIRKYDMKEVYPVPAEFEKTARTNEQEYFERYQKSIEQPDEYWAEQALKLDWIKPFSQVKNTSYDKDNFKIEWFADGQLNLSANCLDRHLKEHPYKPAIIWEGDHPSRHKIISFAELYDEVCRFANVLKKHGVVKGDRVVLYMPMISEAAISMLACARIGAVHCVVFGGFSPDSLASRIDDSQAKIVITADSGMRGGKPIPLKANVDAALNLPGTDSVQNVIVVHRTGNPIMLKEGRDLWYHMEIMTVNEICPPEPMNAEDPLFILYTSGSTGTPKGVVHTCGGYILYAAMTHKYVFDYQEGDIYWCTADAGWITGHSYIFYGPLANGATTLVFEGVPTYPDAGRFWQVCDKHQVNIFYTAPTAIRALMSIGDELVEKADLSSVRLLGTVGEPINPEAWHWYYEVVGKSNCPVVDTWWQTETGGIMITSLPGAVGMKPGCAGKPFFGVQPALLDKEGNTLEGENQGLLVMTGSWPGQLRTVYGDHDRFYQTYLSQYPGNYFTGDGAKRDKDDFYWITGRVDDVLNVSGHRLGTAEIESALVLHPSVAEAAVVGYPHEIKGQGVYCYVTLMKDATQSDKLNSELKEFVANELGRFAKPDYIQWAPGLPKTRSGKIMRRILRKIAENDVDTLGDTSTLADPSVVDNLIEQRIFQGS